jgi:hypothetical protein
MNRALSTRETKPRADVADTVDPDLHWRPDLPNRQWLPGSIRREDFASIRAIERYLNTLDIAYHEATYGPVQ